MNNWITGRAFFIAAFLMALAGLQRFLTSDFGFEATVRYVSAIIGGGFVWAVVGLFLYRKFKK
jgi:hypothetical protein